MSKRISIEERIVDWFSIAGGPEARLMLAIIKRTMRNNETLLPDKLKATRKVSKPKSITIPADSQILRGHCKEEV